MLIFWIYLAVLAVMSLITFFIYFADKRKAKRREWRIREAVLLSLGFFGGALGALLGMNVFRHKIRRWYFWVENMIFLLLQIGAGVVLYLFKI